jgi:hypothetical protein
MQKCPIVSKYKNCDQLDWNFYMLYVHENVKDPFPSLMSEGSEFDLFRRKD